MKDIVLKNFRSLLPRFLRTLRGMNVEVRLDIRVGREFVNAQQSVSEVPNAAVGGSNQIEVETAKTEDSLLTNVREVLERVPQDFGGGCSLRKAYLFASLIKTYGLKSSVDIGVYRGRSLFPQYLAHRDYSAGRVYGIDPWSEEEADERESNLDEKIKSWLERTDFDEIYRDVSALCEELASPGRKNCVLLRKTSAAAASEFREAGTRFDLIHIDGNHDTENVVADVGSFLPLLEPGGFVVLDDVSWKSVRPAYDLLNSKLTLVYERILRDDDFAVFYAAQHIDDVSAVRNSIHEIIASV